MVEENIKIDEKKIDDDLKTLHLMNKSNTDLNELKKITNEKDSTKKDNKKLLSKVYKYWVYIFKNGDPVADFGVNEEEYGGVKLLVRKEDIGGNEKVIFRELYPESKFDLNTIDKNKNKYKSELNKLKQIQNKLEENQWSANPKEYNYDIADVKLKILEYEIMLDSIKYGKSFRYFHNIRPDGIKCLFYELENSGLKLIKYVKEKSILTEATENKRIESEGSRKQIDHQLKKSSERDWQKIAITFMSILLLAIATYATFQWLNYNEDKAFGDTKKQLEEVVLKQNEFIDKIMVEIERVHKKDATFEEQIIQGNQEILNQCYIPTRIPTGN